MVEKRVGGSDCSNTGKTGKKWTWEITYMTHKRKENYEIMEKWIERAKENIVTISGDLRKNSRKRKNVRLKR